MTDFTDFRAALAKAPRLRLCKPPAFDMAQALYMDGAERASRALEHAITTQGFESLMISSSAPTPSPRARAAARRALKAMMREWRASRALPIIPPNLGGWVLEWVVLHGGVERHLWRGRAEYERVYVM